MEITQVEQFQKCTTQQKLQFLIGINRIRSFIKKQLLISKRTQFLNSFRTFIIKGLVFVKKDISTYVRSRSKVSCFHEHWNTFCVWITTHYSSERILGNAAAAQNNTTKTKSRITFVLKSGNPVWQHTTNIFT